MYLIYLFYPVYTKLTFMVKKILSCVSLLICLNATAQSETENSKNPEINNSTSESAAQFKSGVEAWGKFLSKNLRKNLPIRKKAPAGRYLVVIKFVVDIDGSLVDFEAETNNGYGMEEEVIRVLKLSPKWTPAYQGGKLVKNYLRQPITFVVPKK